MSWAAGKQQWGIRKWELGKGTEEEEADSGDKRRPSEKNPRRKKAVGWGTPLYFVSTNEWNGMEFEKFER